MKDKEMSESATCRCGFNGTHRPTPDCGLMHGSGYCTCPACWDETHAQFHPTCAARIAKLEAEAAELKAHINNARTEQVTE